MKGPVVGIENRGVFAFLIGATNADFVGSWLNISSILSISS